MKKTEKLNLSKYTEDSKEGLMLIFIITTHLLLKNQRKKDMLSNYCESIRQKYSIANKQQQKETTNVIEN